LITINVPRLEDDAYCSIEYGLFGPLNLGNYVSEPISYTHESDSLSEERGCYNENFVRHFKLDGQINYLAEFENVTPAPTTVYPDKVRWLCRNGASYLTKEYYNGIISSGHVATWDMSTQKKYFAYDLHGAQGITVVSVIILKSNPSRIASVTKTMYTSTSHTSTTITFSKLMWTDGALCDRYAYGDLSSTPSFEVMMAIGEDLAKYGPSASTTTISLVFRYGSPKFSLAFAQGVVDGCLGRLMRPVSPIEPIHPGILCAEASERLNRSKVNMLEFIADLKNPTELIPKLRKLRSFKGLASSYLGMQYGVLPFKDDLKNIYEALIRRVPRIDRYGLRNVYGGRTQMTTVDEITYTCQQSVKLGVANEDSRLLSLINGIESWGFLPTFENVWDLVPLSFVIDWFVQVGDLLESVDARLRYERYDIKYATTSQKDTRRLTLVPTASSPYSGSLECVSYVRGVDLTVDPPPLALTTSLQVSDHWLEAGALIVVRSKN